MSKQAEGVVRSHEQRVDPETVDQIKGMTDRVLEDLGFPSGETTPVPVVVFTVTKPANPDYKLKIYSIEDGVGGYNTSVGNAPADDNSRRWHVEIDRGEGSTGTAYDNKGTIYAHGGYQPRHYQHENIDTGTIQELVADFDDNPDGTVLVELLRQYTVAAEFGPVPLHPAPVEA